MMRTGLIFMMIILCVATCFAQKDSTVLKEVVIFGLPEEKYLAGSELIRVDSSLMARERSRHLGDMLSLQLPIYFRNYGNGMLSSISMRGTSPQHTSVLWNGISITNFSLGQVDFSILPAAAFDEVKVHAGAGSARFGSGAIGGTVLLNTDASQTTNSITISQEVGSFGRYFTSLNGRWHKHRWGGATKFYRLASDNNFPILATGERQQNAAFNQSGLVQDVEYRISSARKISAHYWYHQADRQIQPSIGVFNTDNHQQDRSHRLVVRYQENGGRGLLQAFGGYVRDEIVYNASPSNVVRWIAGATHQYTWKNINIQSGAEWNHIVGKVSNYQRGIATENRYDFTASLQREMTKRLALALNFRQPMVVGFRAPFLPYIGADYLVLKRPNSEWKVRGSVSKNFRIPTLNDRYWQNSGSLDLLPETTHAIEAGWNWKFGIVEIANTWFSQKVDNWIQWVPQQNGNYIPRNIKQVLAEGFEVKVSARQKLSGVTVVSCISYQLTKSTTIQAPASEQFVIDKQLMYTPRHTASAFGQIIWKTFSFDFSAQYVGVRFTTSDNSIDYQLPAFALCNAGVGKLWKIHEHRFDVSFSAKNIFNTDYQMYEARAMPGRNYNVQVSYQLKSKSLYE